MKKWRVEGILDTETVTEFAKKLEGTMNKLEAEGYDVREPQPIGKHYFVVGRAHEVKVKKGGR